MAASVDVHYGNRNTTRIGRVVRSLIRKMVDRQITATGPSVSNENTRYQGDVLASFEELQAMLGKPTRINPDPAHGEPTIEWNAVIDGERVAIYDMRCYASAVSLDTYLWSIGGENRRAVGSVVSSLNLFRITR